MALFGNNNHRSILDENSTFYTPQEQKTEKQKWADMDNRQRFRYFKDYYLLKCLILIFAIFLTGILFYSCLKPRKTRMLFVAVVQNTLFPEGKEQLKYQFESLFITDPDRQEVILDDSFPMGYETEAKLAAYIGSKEIDLIITNEERFKEMAEAGFFEDLSEVVPELNTNHTDLLFYSNITVDNHTNNNISSNTRSDISTNRASISNTQDMNHKKITNDSAAYGIYITDCNTFKNAWPAKSKAVIGILVNSQHKENAKLALIELLS